MARPSKQEHAIYVISVAAELAGVHPQTLRVYERKGLVQPSRTSGNTRRYSDSDITLLRRIQELTNELGMNLAGVEKVFELEDEMRRMRKRMKELERRSQRLEKELVDEIERVRRSFKRELVRYEPPGSALVPARGRGDGAIRVPISRRR